MAMLEYVRRIRTLRTAFRRTFNGPGGALHEDGKAVLKELRRFCFADRPTLRTDAEGRVDPYASIAAAARQEVYWRVVKLMDLDDSDLNQLENMDA